MLNTTRFASAALAIAALLCALPISAQTTPKISNTGYEQTKTLLYVGNSFYYYNDSMHTKVLGLVNAADPKARGQYRSTSITISGSGFNWHDMESYFRPGAVASYSFVGDNEIRFNKFDKPFDAVIMNDCSQCPVHPQLKGMFHEYAAKHSATVRKHGAKPILFMTWAYADKPEMTQQLAEEYTKAGNANDALVIPAGLAFAKAIAKKPGIGMYAADKRHPSRLGTYLSACTIYAALYNKSPVGLSYTFGIDPETAKFLQEVAWETVQEYYGRS
jgi:hypothetical protein